ncbi:Uncharacterized protein dnm_032320 [Desulfonema magnum]|uniref:Uncharacterized protein n=1 Tax=Desulfonema magnum TaxID=45655 RepID=A0A975BKF9_9BACT|nr:Uncharacterized protein dnm_032320 [Desulfonema magnum]
MSGRQEIPNAAVRTFLHDGTMSECNEENVSFLLKNRG